MMNPDASAFRRFIESQTRISRPNLLPEIKLHLATEITPIWHATEETLAKAELPPPFWAFCWPGGEALARFILDRPELVRGKRVLDFACGGGVVAIAAALSGGDVTGCDIDPFAVAAMRLNGALNGVALNGSNSDPTADADPDAEVILAGDVFYESAMAECATVWFKARADAGCTVLIGDPGRTYLPRDDLRREMAFDVPTSRELEDTTLRRTSIWRF